MRWLEPQCARHTRSVEVAGLARRGRAFTCSGAPSQPTKAAVDPIKEALQAFPPAPRLGRSSDGGSAADVHSAAVGHETNAGPRVRPGTPAAPSPGRGRRRRRTGTPSRRSWATARRPQAAVAALSPSFADWVYRFSGAADLYREMAQRESPA